MGLAALGTDPGTRSASDAGTGVCDGHDLALDLVVALKADEVAILGDPFQVHDGAPTDFETTATSDAGLGIDGEEIGRQPGPAAAGYGLQFKLCRYHLSSHSSETSLVRNGS